MYKNLEPLNIVICTDSKTKSLLAVSLATMVVQWCVELCKAYNQYMIIES